MLECVPILLPEPLNFLDDLWCCIRDLDRVGLNMGNSKALILHKVLEVNHEQSTTFRNDVVFVPWIEKCVWEMSARQSVYRIDNDLESIRQSFCVFFLSDIRSESAIEHLPSITIVPSFNGQPGIFNIAEIPGVLFAK